MKLYFKRIISLSKFLQLFCNSLTIIVTYQSLLSSFVSAVCVHPRTRAKKGKRVVVASPPHVSTGSTVDTFLPHDLGVLSDDEKVVVGSDDENRLGPIPENK